MPRQLHRLPVSEEFPSEESFAWFIYDRDTGDMSDYLDRVGKRYLGVEDAVRTVIAVDQQHGPFTYVIGFSQGAVFVHWLLAQRRAEQASVARGALPALRAAIFLGGFASRESEVEPPSLRTGIAMPSLHIIGPFSGPCLTSRLHLGKGERGKGHRRLLLP